MEIRNGWTVWLTVQLENQAGGGVTLHDYVILIHTQILYTHVLFMSSSIIHRRRNWGGRGSVPHKFG